MSDNNEYHDKINKKFSEAVYQKMAEKRFGVKFCCETDFDKWLIDQQLLTLNNLVDPELAVVVCPEDPDPNAPLRNCAITCLNFTNVCPSSYRDLMLFLTNGNNHMTGLVLIDTWEELYPELYALIVDTFPCLFEPMGCCSTAQNCYDLFAAWVKDLQYPAEYEALIKGVAALLEADFKLLLEYCRAYFQAYGDWEVSGYDEGKLPSQLDGIILTYTTCFGVVTTVPFGICMTVYRDPDQNIILDNPNFNGPYADELDYNAFMLDHFDIATEKCDCCKPGDCDYRLTYVNAPFADSDYLDYPPIFPTEYELDIIVAPNQCENTWVNAYAEFLVYSKKLIQTELYPQPAPTEELPPNYTAPCYIHKGPQNEGWINYRIANGCPCTPDANYLPFVELVFDLPTTGNSGDAIYVKDEGRFYAWDPIGLVWDPTYYSNTYETCYNTNNAERNEMFDAYDAFTKAMKPFTWAAYHIPKFQILKYKL